MKANNGYALPKKNLVFLAVGFAIILLGFILMIGGGAEGTEFNPEIYNTQRVTVGPMIALFGFLFEIFAILWVPAEKEETGITVSEYNKEESGVVVSDDDSNNNSLTANF